ncbi:putative Phosphoadenosine phosphosulfate reductase family [Trypanosoma vivax]|uniref:FAD synthase n=1 Tax=Trypanosoma vivax (strain Y486) TaxID=1055687 RepID=G0UBX0_TRYVY|nr:putative phosphoadenosine phosphosulfate reductase-like protein [Trypanosoma vivax]KAH8609458.1 putative Phosphoadenosine phosphosulfate reductase family [Trypanosoma vivax]KAH8609488.1 putative Phosphoadenosine phosphosulfate reductase family [Trypanosoma vivax]CCC53318.1 putative phosphoadenosine phosphosulfate reductase-like protein [Trypanosoma vivax Y486]
MSRPTVSDRTVTLAGPGVTDATLAELCAKSSPQCIELESCGRVTDLSPLARVPSLREVIVSNCRSVRYLGPLGQGPGSLRRLVFRRTPVTRAQASDMTGGSMELVADAVGPAGVLRPPQSLVRSSIDLIRNVAGPYRAEEIGIAFNGGKDSVVMMDLFRCAMGTEFMSRCCVFYLGTSSEEFGEVVRFRNDFVRDWGLSLTEPGGAASMKDSLARVKEMRGICVAFMGTRVSDGGHQTDEVERTTAGWPDLVRVCPVFHWDYEDVWGYTLTYGLPYCPLYTLGYTSLGDLSTTIPNPLLRRDDGTFHPAWELTDGSAERRGRFVV